MSQARERLQKGSIPQEIRSTCMPAALTIVRTIRCGQDYVTIALSHCRVGESDIRSYQRSAKNVCSTRQRYKEMEAFA